MPVNLKLCFLGDKRSIENNWSNYLPECFDLKTLTYFCFRIF